MSSVDAHMLGLVRSWSFGYASKLPSGHSGLSPAPCEPLDCRRRNHDRIRFAGNKQNPARDEEFIRPCAQYCEVVCGTQIYGHGAVTLVPDRPDPPESKVEGY